MLMRMHSCSRSPGLELVLLAPKAQIKASKKKGCKQAKCSKWKGGGCRCGND